MSCSVPGSLQYVVSRRKERVLESGGVLVRVNLNFGRTASNNRYLLKPNTVSNTSCIMILIRLYRVQPPMAVAQKCVGEFYR
jgi:hypothetical protein